VNLSRVSLVDEVALTRSDVPLSDGGVGRPGVDVGVPNGHAGDVRGVAAGRRKENIESIDEFNRSRYSSRYLIGLFVLSTECAEQPPVLVVLVKSTRDGPNSDRRRRRRINSTKSAYLLVGLKGTVN
jgi:hypothetical protein